MPVKLDKECGPKCRSHQHALCINSAITKCGLKEFKAYSTLCTSAMNVNDNFGRNVLHVAASCGRLDIIEYLLEEKQYNLKAKDHESGWTALHRALFYGQLAAARLLIDYKHDLRTRDHEGLSPLDIVMKDRPNYISFSPREPNEVYTWGDNSNYNLGHSSEGRRGVPERVSILKRASNCIIQVVLCKFHTVFLTQTGQVYTCGHGHGGRLGHGDQQTCIVPRFVESLKKETCIQIAAGRDHTLFFTERGNVYGCGSNESHQLALPSPETERVFVPKLMKADYFKGYQIKGICAGRYHSVVYSPDAVFTFGLNGGQLGHSRGDKFQIQPRMISGLNEPDIRISLVECSDSATVCLTTLGNIYVCSRYNCRRIGPRWQDITKISVSGGTLDQTLTTDLDLLKQKGASELMVAMLNKQGRVMLWRERSPRFKRCNWAIRREVMITDVCINRNNMAITTDKGEAFTGIWQPIKDSSKKKSLQNQPKSREVSNEFPQLRLLDLLMKDEVEDVQLERIPNTHRATNIWSDSKGTNFAVLQVLPNGCLTEIPNVRATNIREDFKNLLEEADEADVVHDVILQVQNKSWALHKFILASRSSTLHKMIMDSQGKDEKTILTFDDIHPVIMEEIISFIYTDNCRALMIDGKFELEDASNEDKEDVEPKVELMTKTQRKRYNKRLEKENLKKLEMEPPKTALCLLREAAQELGIERLEKRLQAVNSLNGIICSNGRTLARPNLKFNRTSVPELYDVCISADDGTIIKCHKCILVARLDYFHSMLTTGWIETSDASGLSLPVSGKLLQILIDFIYTGEAEFLSDCVNVELLCNVLVLADKLLIERLKELSEVALVNSMNFSNVTDLLNFSLIYNAPQLYISCQQFICLNLPVFLESKLLNNLDDDIIEKLTIYYRKLVPGMSKRMITPYSEGPSREYLSYLASKYNEDEGAVICEVAPRQGKERRKSESETPIKKTGNRRHRDRQISMCSDVSNRSEDGDNLLAEIDENMSNHISTPSSLPISVPLSCEQDILASSPSESDNTSPRNMSSPKSPSGIFSLRDIMKEEKTHNKPQKKTPSSSGKSKISWKDVKKLQNQKEALEKQQKAAEKKKKEKPKEVTCPWASPVNQVVKSFRDLMMEEEVEKPSASTVVKRIAKISTSESETCVEVADTGSLSKSPQDFSLSSWMKFPTKQKQVEKSPEVKVHVNPWQKIPKVQSPPLPDHSFNDILKDERHKKIVLEKIKKKPFKYVQIEDAAIQELLRHYKAFDNFDELITVDRVTTEGVTPMWIKKESKTTSSIW